MIKRVLVFIMLINLFANTYGHPWKPEHYVIIDTDGGLDDLRTITLLLAAYDVRILGIIASPGVLSSEDCYIKVKSLLNSLYHEGIPVALNVKNDIEAKNCPAAKYFKLPGNENIDTSALINEMQLIDEILKNADRDITFINLGSLNTVNKVISSSGTYGRLKEFIWCNDHTEKKKGFNYILDSVSAMSVFTKYPDIKIISPQEMRYSDHYLNKIAATGSPYSRIFLTTLNGEQSSPFQDRIFDESAAVYIHFSDRFKNYSCKQTQSCFFIDTSEIQQYIYEILNEGPSVLNQVFLQYPEDTSFYQEDVRKIIDITIKRFGKEEWNAGVIANEMHKHIGIYNIIGVKMGMRAREYYKIGMDEFKIISYTGKIPPFSCMNDGLQVSTGATVGHGLISVSDDTIRLPAADFYYQNKGIRLRLKDEIFNKIKKEIGEYKYLYGLESDVYWDLVRISALNYWKNFDRHEIFEIEVIK